ncbi:MAG TPA: hypothetical protein VF824_12745 [Thermoanaerobaculia bacterium]
MNENRSSTELAERNAKHLGRAQYTAVRLRTGVRLYAVGFNPGGGYHNFFERLPIDIWPPQFAFYSVPPEIGPDVITFFVVDTAFLAFDDVKEVIVHDADGEHRVPVAGSMKDGGDGPFPRFTP